MNDDSERAWYPKVNGRYVRVTRAVAVWSSRGLHGVLSRSQRASEGETRLLRGLLGLAAESAGQEQLVPLSPVVRLSQARGHLCARKLF